MAEIDDCTNLKQRVQHVITEEIAPALQMEGGSIDVLSVDEGGVVRVRLIGSCAGCPSTVYAIIMGIEEELRRRVPEVNYLEAVP